MEIYYARTKTERIFDSESELDRKYGKQHGKKIRQRLTQLAAAESLENLSFVPGINCHPLKGTRKGEYGITTVEPFRLVIKIGNNPVPRRMDGGVDLSMVTEVFIMEVTDYHGRK